MPESREAGQDWVESPVARLNRLERQVHRNSDALNRGVADQAQMREALGAMRKAIEAIQHTLEQDQSEEIAELKRRAELPRRILLAVAIPVLIAVISAVILAVIGHIHVA